MHSHLASRIALALGVLLVAAAPALAQEEPQTRETVPQDAPTQPTDDGFGNDEPFENVQENPTGPGGPVTWWGPLLFALAVVAGVLVFRHLRRGHGRRRP